MSKNKTIEQSSHESSGVLPALFDQIILDTPSLSQGLENLSTLPPFESVQASPIPGTVFSPGVIAFSRYSRSVSVACGKAMVRQIQLRKFIGMVENLNEDREATVVLQNFQEQENNQQARGQILGRINRNHSAITIVQGLTGRAIKGFNDISSQDHYYINRSDLAAFYIAAKFQLLNEPTLESIQNAFDGWRAFEIPLNPLRPHEFTSVPAGGE